MAAEKDDDEDKSQTAAGRELQEFPVTLQVLLTPSSSVVKPRMCCQV